MKLLAVRGSPRLFVVPAAQGAVVVEPKGRVTHGPDDGCREQALDFVAGECDQPDRGGTAGVLLGTDDREEGVGDVPARPQDEAPDLVLVWKILSVRYRRPSSSRSWRMSPNSSST